MFVMAAIYASAGSTPVKLRNVSPRGALIEGAVVPPLGSRVRLCRGSLSVTAAIVWSKEGRAGLRFESTVCVDDWLPRNRAMTPQERVDEMVGQVKASALVPRSPADDVTSESGKAGALGLVRLAHALESLAEDLTADPDVVKRHLLKIQTLDVAAQALRKVAAER